jgi:hypothetical protein
MSAPTVGDITAHAIVLKSMASALLAAIESGKYAHDIAVTENVLGGLGIIFPPVEEAELAIRAFLFLNSLAPRGGGIQHGRSIIDPVTGQFTGEKT